MTLCRKILILTLFCQFWSYGPVRAEVFHTKESALAAAFPNGERVEARQLFLSQEDQQQITKIAGSHWPTRLATAYVGISNGHTVGYAIFDTHKVRSMTETVLVVVAEDGSVSHLELVSFHEPSEFLPTNRWVKALTGKKLNSKLSLNGGVDTISGATLTSRAMTSATRRVLALYDVKLKRDTGLQDEDKPTN